MGAHDPGRECGGCGCFGGVHAPWCKELNQNAERVKRVAEAAGAATALKYDSSKPPLHLIAPDFLYAIAEILDFGARKYAPRNWEKGMAWSRCYRACIGHLFDWWLGKGPDPETGKSHLWHAACCIMFLVCYELRDVGTDDRPKTGT